MPPQLNTSIGTVDTLSSYLSLIDKVWMEWTNPLDHIETIWFRGHADTAWPLLPGTLRPGYKNVSEHRYRHDFFLRAQPFLNESTVPPTSDWDWYFLMQHYGVPTRLLDWTESALVALYFSVHPTPQDCPGCVWVINPRTLNNKLAKLGNFVPIYSDKSVNAYLPSLWDERPLIIPAAPIAIDPPLNSPRLAAQRGKFTVHGRSCLALESSPSLKNSLLRIDIPAQVKGRIVRQLMSAGMTEGVLFPGLAGLSREIRDAYAVGFDI